MNFYIYIATGITYIWIVYITISAVKKRGRNPDG